MKLKETKREYRIRVHQHLSSIGFKDKDTRDKIIDRAPEGVKHKIDRVLQGLGRRQAYNVAKQWISPTAIQY